MDELKANNGTSDGSPHEAMKRPLKKTSGPPTSRVSAPKTKRKEIFSSHGVLSSLSCCQSKVMFGVWFAQLRESEYLVARFRAPGFTNRSRSVHTDPAF